MTTTSPTDTPVTISFQVGTAKIALADLLSLAENTIIEGEALYTYFPKVRALLGDRQIAEGELVKVDDKVGFRVTKVL
jgi:flagellar motor switch/type III secretory pathway protein FliN